MPNYRRLYVPGGTYFFTVVTHARRRFLTTPAARKCLRHAWLATREKYPFRSRALCLLPDHLHCVWTLPPGDADFSSRWKMLKGLFSRRFLRNGGWDLPRSPSRRRKREVAVWHRRFYDRLVRSPQAMERIIRYIHENPVKHGYVKTPEEWPWSTYRAYLRREKALRQLTRPTRCPPAST